MLSLNEGSFIFTSCPCPVSATKASRAVMMVVFFIVLLFKYFML